MSITGTNASEIAASLNKIQAAYENLMAALHDRMQAEFIDQLGEQWACEDAQDYFNNTVKPTMDDMLSASYKTFQNIVETMNSWGASWSQLHKSNWSNIQFNGLLKTVDVSCIKLDINGGKGIDEEEANATAANLTSIESDVNSAVSEAESAVHECGFLDPGVMMESNLISSLNTIKSKFEEAIAEVREGFKTHVNKTVELHGQTKFKNADAFTIHEG